MLVDLKKIPAILTFSPSAKSKRSSKSVCGSIIMSLVMTGILPFGSFHKSVENRRCRNHPSSDQEFLTAFAIAMFSSTTDIYVLYILNLPAHVQKKKRIYFGNSLHLFGSIYFLTSFAFK